MAMKAKLRIIGGIITALSMILLFIKISRMDIDWSVILIEKYLRTTVFCIVFYGFMMVLCFIPWKNLVEICCGKIGQLKNQKLLFCYVFSKANILKYIPGNIVQYIGRNEIAFELGLSHLDVVLASAAEIVIITTIALLISVITVQSYTLYYLQQWISRNLLLLLIGLAIVIALAIVVLNKYHGYVRRQLSQFGQSLKRYGAIRNLLIAGVFYLLLLLVNAFVFICVLKLDDNAIVSNEMIPILVGAYMLSWLIGYITPGAPGGIGIREIILISIIKGIGAATELTIIQAAVIVRLITITGDMLAFLVVLCIAKCQGSCQ